MKEDAPPPKHPPRKRYQLEKAPDYWLAVWATDEDLPEDERQRAQEVRERRRAALPERRVGLLIDREGMTPPQMEMLFERMRGLRPTEIHHPWAPKAIHSACRALDVPVIVHRDVRSDYSSLREVVLASHLILAAPRGVEKHDHRTPAWDSIHYAKHRKLPTTVILPDGSTKGEDG